MGVFLDKTDKKLVAEIVGGLDMGCNCYYNLKTGQYIELPDFEEMMDVSDFEEAFKEEIKTIKKHKKDFIHFEKMDSKDFFNLMERFVDQLPHIQVKLELEKALQNRKSFQNFKNIVACSMHSEDWFDFKQKELGIIVEKKLKR